MPIYEYTCPSCAKTFESLERMDTKKCICTCGVMANQIVSASSFTFSNKNGWNGDSEKLLKHRPKRPK